MRVGFTGSRHGMTPVQRAAVEAWLTEHAADITEFHHGDCVGADEQANDLAMLYLDAATSHAHPATMNPEWDAKWQAHTADTYSHGSIMEHPAKSPRARNLDIVKATDVLIACPADINDETGGTWMTIKMGLNRVRSHGYRVLIVHPETGSVVTW